MIFARDIKNFFTKSSAYTDVPVFQDVSTIQFEVTNRCNLNCSICWRALRGKQPKVKDLSFTLFKSALDNLVGLFKIRALNTQGLGEPLLCPDILRIFSYAKSKDITIWFVTNGTLIDEFVSKQLIEIKVDKIRISIDSPFEEIYGKIKQGGNLNKVKNNITLLNEYKKQFNSNFPSIAFNTVVFKKTLPGINRLIDLAHELMVSEISLIPMVDFSRGMAIKDEQIDFYEGEFQQRFNQWKTMAQGLSIDLNLGISMESRETKFCKKGFYIDVEGYIHPCCNISQLAFGNIFKHKIEHIAAGYLKFRQWLDKANVLCKECNKILDT
jgi:MoaA/NifB/PqqE/SkfB family radical SAM enzyme